MAFALLPKVLAICSTNRMTSAYSPLRWSLVMLITWAIITSMNQYPVVVK